jgi:hypothetical protein
MSLPKSFLLQVLVTVNADGTFSTEVRSYFDDTILTGPLYVNLGDQVAWMVQVFTPAGRKQLPYSVDFNNKKFFGIGSFEVPDGSVSSYLPVLSLKGQVHYEVQVTGLGLVLDPDIQSGSDSMLVPQSLTTGYAVLWDVGSNTMAYSNIAMSGSQPFPPDGLLLSRGDSVTFQATVNATTVTGFTLTFPDNNNAWQTPFDPNRASFVADQSTPQTIGPLRVNDPADAGDDFPFIASLTADGTNYAFPGAPNVKFKL